MEKKEKLKTYTHTIDGIFDEIKRREGGLTKFASDTGLSYWVVYSTLTGRSSGLRSIQKICRTYGIDISDVKEWQ